MDQFKTTLLDESKWFTSSMLIAIVVTITLLVLTKNKSIPKDQQIKAAMNLVYGIIIGIMALGHLVAISIKEYFGTLLGSLPLLYIIGVSLATPSVWLTYQGWKLIGEKDNHGKRIIMLNSWTATTLLFFGIPNIPLIIPGILNIVYQLSSVRAIKLIAAILTLIVYIGLFIGSIVFFMSGKTFEEFRGFI